MALIEGNLYLGAKADLPSGAWMGAAIWLTSGAALLVGLLTPIAGIAAGLSTLGIGFSLFPAPAPNLFDTKLPLVLTGIMIAAVVILGPGRYSMDARLFGHREIIIPPSPRRPER